MNWYFAVLRKYAVFSGRARRKEYWYFHFVDFIIILTLTLLSIVLKFNLNSIHIGYILLTLLPRYAVLTRRLHDIGKSGWWIGFPSMPWLVMLSAIATLLLVAPNNPILANNFNISSLSMASVNNQAPTQSAPAPAAGPINNDPAVITNTAPAQNPNVVTSPNLSTKTSEDDLISNIAKMVADKINNISFNDIKNNVEIQMILLVLIFGIFLFPFMLVFCSTVVFTFTVIEGQLKDNKYGPNPKADK